MAKETQKLNENLGGRPPIFKDVQDMQKKIDKYFKHCPDKKVYTTKTGMKIEVPIPTISGLCHYLGFESRQSFYDYQDKPEFSYTVKRARLFIEKEYEQMLQSQYSTGAIFALKNFGWIDKTQQEITGKDGAPLSVQKVFVTPEMKKEAENFTKELLNG